MCLCIHSSLKSLYIWAQVHKDQYRTKGKNKIMHPLLSLTLYLLSGLFLSINGDRNIPIYLFIYVDREVN